MSIDRVVYTANSGLKQVMDRMSTSAENLANVSTTGFRAQIDAARSVPVIGPGNGLPTRALAVDATVGTSFKEGTIDQTGNNLDVAIEGKGWIAVQGPDGQEAYTRAGNLSLDTAGMLQTRTGQKVLGDGGPITIPPNSTVLIGKDGTVSVSQTGIASNTIQVLGRIKLVDPPENELLRGDDGLFRLAGGQTAPASAAVTLVSGMIENSNVNAVDEMVAMIDLSRQFETHAKLLKDADTNAGKADQIMSLS